MQSLKGFVASASDVRNATKIVGRFSNKYTRGRVLIFAASEQWRGAMEMAAWGAYNALAALRVGAGFVTIAAPKNVLDIAGNLSPVFVLSELKGSVSAQLAKIRHDAIVVGPGLEESHIPVALFTKIQRFERKKGNIIVVDAAALHVFRNRRFSGKEFILTPHDGEFKKMTSIDLKDKSVQERIKIAKKFAKKHACTLVLKGHVTIITDGERLKVNISKTPALATMGTGDVLSGMIAAYASMRKEAFDSAVAAVYVHSMIGDMLYKRKGEHIIAQDVIDEIPNVLKRFDRIS